eukprot:CAMPEP_0118642556 /NCGR_PEP_ID=MMETSP0785-20121206/5895_1 /TAXON_ID=91992 /ORGANISM="Bolidomonas pacifica, Strain CCMP 1866" /LENGTH=51 /DNA_ID=CAMNT_0006534109 /DNA_START=329 /DNA_END=484 /DNA_ORIENTATION=-
MPPSFFDLSPSPHPLLKRESTLPLQLENLPTCQLSSEMFSTTSMPPSLWWK